RRATRSATTRGRTRRRRRRRRWPSSPRRARRRGCSSACSAGARISTARRTGSSPPASPSACGRSARPSCCGTATPRTSRPARRSPSGAGSRTSRSPAATSSSSTTCIRTSRPRSTPSSRAPTGSASPSPRRRNGSMVDAPTILYFGNDWSGENRTSSHHVARWLAQRYRVIYVECPGLRAPKGTGRDLRKVAAKLRLALAGPRPQPEGLSVQTLLQIPLHRFELVRRANRGLIRLSLKLLLARLGVRAPVTWFVVPHLAGVVGRLGERLSVYYCIDDYASLPDVDADAVRAMDDELTRRADLVFVASDTLLARKRALNPETYVSPHGVDFAHFARALDPALAIPDDIAALPRPIVGFFGLIERWIDLGLMDYLAERRPGWTFLMIGRVAVPDAEVPKRPNLVYLGPRPYPTLPAYGKAFAAAIIPYHLTPQVLHANPIKLR